MNWEAMGAIGETLGATGVIVTLIYLGTQLRQNTKALRSSTYEAYANSGTALNDYMGRHAEEILSVLSGDMDEFSEHLRNGSPTTASELVFISYAHRSFNLMESTYLHHRAGLLDDDIFDARVRGFGNYMREMSSLQIVWETGQELAYTDEFREFMRKRILAPAEAGT